MGREIRILTADDHPLVREGLKAVLSAEPGVVVVAEAAEGQEAVAQYRALRPDVVIMDLEMPGMSGLDAIRAIIALDPAARILVLTTFDGDADIHHALEAGRRGICSSTWRARAWSTPCRPWPPVVAPCRRRWRSDSRRRCRAPS